MPRTKAQYDNGILTINDVAKLLALSLPTVRRYCDNNEFPGSFRVHSSNERRIPATGVRSFIEKNSYPMPAALAALVTAYEKYRSQTLREKA